jgi:hypothetical protein
LRWLHLRILSCFRASSEETFLWCVPHRTVPTWVIIIFFQMWNSYWCRIKSVFFLSQNILSVQLKSDQADHLHVYLYLINHTESFVFVMPLKWLEHMDVLWLKARNGTKNKIFAFKYVSLANVNIYWLWFIIWNL